MEGIFLIDKPAGMTSFDVIRKLRGKLNTKEIGHAGTLDPMATGLLVVLVGKATKLSDLLTSETKSYQGTITFGTATDTYDRLGKITETMTDFTLNELDIDTTIKSFLVKDSQVPPIYSAIKIQGKKLYQYARQEQSIEIEERPMEILSFVRTTALIQNSFSFEIEVSKGTYIRSIAHDFGIVLGIPSHLSALRRTQSGRYSISTAYRLTEIDEFTLPNFSLEDYAKSLPKLVIEDYLIPLIRNGVRLDERQTTMEGPFTAYNKQEQPIAIFKKDGKNYKPLIQLGE
ncbi:tRNA pseudouridine(55) synthase TruB [Acholeplasma vituli]|uniref:tRNA pseudouridine synthase B n=1 Tax=Paracholeplasma vituli TaxID=69473 RepID=A0ABT2PV88_9MOLU|nr:tRNA pseudouridine(55) synthase TruB [Paracholeplasma vituli]MCU0104859.1 tRNA pseudouridine(55) synthase TruB [Paracholeplasma vituli]